MNPREMTFGLSHWVAFLVCLFIRSICFDLCLLAGWLVAGLVGWFIQSCVSLQCLFPHMPGVYSCFKKGCQKKMHLTILTFRLSGI